MSKNKAATLWGINVSLAILCFILGITGFLNWWFIPRGYGVRNSIFFSIRHFLLEVHQWAALIFVIMVAVHIYLHWAYVVTNLKKHGVLKK